MNQTAEINPFAEVLPENFDSSVRLTASELGQHLRLMASLKMFELGKISSGNAAKLAGMSRVDFFETCGRYRVSPFNYAPGEIPAEIRKELDAIGSWAPT